MKAININESPSVLYTLNNGKELEITCVELVGDEYSYGRSERALTERWIER